MGVFHKRKGGLVLMRGCLSMFHMTQSMGSLSVFSRTAAASALRRGLCSSRPEFVLPAAPSCGVVAPASVLFTPLSMPTLSVPGFEEEIVLEYPHDPDTATGLVCSNLLKKRARKMNRHKHRKNLKKQRFLRRKLGK